MAAHITLFKGVVHGWDLAAPTGQMLDVSSEVEDAVLLIAQMLCNDKPFRTDVSVADSASSLVKALGLTGRDPNWST